MARRYLRLLSGLATQDPTLAGQLLPLAASFGTPEQLARRWVVAEAAFSHGSLKAALKAPEDEGAAAGAQPLWKTATPHGGLQRLLWQPERTLQLMDQQWLGLLKRVDAGLTDALAATAPEAGASGLLRWWRNPWGQMMVDAARDAYQPYLRRQADLELHREAVVLALNAQRLQVAPAGRAAWAQEQPMSNALRERLSWSADGSQLTVRTWFADGLQPGDTVSPRDTITITLDRPPVG